MITEDQMMKIFVEANPAPDVDALELVEVGSAAYLATLETRSSEMTRADPSKDKTRIDTNKDKRPALSWLVAAVVLVVVGVGLALVTQNDDTTTVATSPSTIPTTVAQPDDAAFMESAEESVNAWIDAYNDGNDAAVLELLAAEVNITDGIQGSWPMDEWAMFLAWNTAQGSIFTSRECSASEPDLGVSVVVRCSSDSRDAVTQAVDSPPVPADLIFRVTADGISSMTFQYVGLDFSHVGEPFAIWMEANHPEIAEAGTIGFGNWDTLEEARANGRLTAQYAAEWAVYLTENNCTYLDGC